MKEPSSTLLKAIAVTAELTGTEMTTEGARLFAQDLAQYPEEQVLRSLTNCRRELSRKICVADVIRRLDDGRPGPEEAWSMLPTSEMDTIVWSNEIADAWQASCKLMDDGHQIQARMVFKEVYERVVREAREQGIQPKWYVSLGTDKFSRAPALEKGIAKGWLKQSVLNALIEGGQVPSLEHQQKQNTQLKKVGEGE